MPTPAKQNELTSLNKPQVFGLFLVPFELKPLWLAWVGEEMPPVEQVWRQY
ncbi:hypothetical protein [Nostoc sp.]|uniref:hypothetical protein n=1 Tax=Nostoc sp. TaxID=1180 RepID=UPI002FF9AD3F